MDEPMASKCHLVYVRGDSLDTFGDKEWQHKFCDLKKSVSIIGKNQLVMVALVFLTENLQNHFF
jgi:hypothetical protein